MPALVCIIMWLLFGCVRVLALSKALSSLPSLSHYLGEVMLQGVATSHLASAEDAKSNYYRSTTYSLHAHLDGIVMMTSNYPLLLLLLL